MHVATCRCQGGYSNRKHWQNCCCTPIRSGGGHPAGRSGIFMLQFYKVERQASCGFLECSFFSNSNPFPAPGIIDLGPLRRRHWSIQDIALSGHSDNLKKFPGNLTVTELPPGYVHDSPSEMLNSRIHRVLINEDSIIRLHEETISGETNMTSTRNKAPCLTLGKHISSTWQ